MEEETKQKSITLPYKIILKRIWGESNFGKIGVSHFKRILIIRFRMGKENCTRIYNEMKKLNYLSNCGDRGAEIKIEVALKDLV